MKKSYSDVINELSGNNIGIFEEIISKKYKQFKKFYNIIRNHADEIAGIHYKFSDSSSLDIDVIVKSEVDINEFIDEISSENKYYHIGISQDLRIVYMSIYIP